MSSSRRPPKRRSRVKVIAKPATAKRTAAKGTKATRPVSRRPSPRRPAASAPKPAPQPASRPSPSPAIRTGIRLAGSASSRLTIKPGAPTIPKPKLELSTKARPSGLRPLSQVELDEDEVLVDAFDATLNGIRVHITAVLERTCVYVGRDGDRRLARKMISGSKPTSCRFDAAASPNEGV